MTTTKALTTILLMFASIFLVSFAITIYVGLNHMPLRTSVEQYIPAAALDRPSDACKDAYQQYIFQKYSNPTAPAWKPDSDCLQKATYHSMIL